MFCTNCGKEIPEKSSFCTECGHPIGSSKKDVESTSQPPSRSPEEMEQAYYYLLLLEQAKHTANVEIFKGIGWAVLGLVITAITYAMAEDGGTYFVFWGLVIYGAYIFLRGLFWRISPNSLVKKALEAKAAEPEINKEK
jgi:hypothetical protein